VALGEVLWDLFPTARHLGGAPLNFAVHAKHLGAEAYIVSRIGRDALGDEIVGALRRFRIPLETVQTDPERPTGRVNVTLDSKGQPTFEIVRDVAWDAIEETPLAQALAGRADGLCIGTLAQRSTRSRTSIQGLVSRARKARLVVCDINFRQRFYNCAIVESSLRAATLLKLNDAELPAMLDLLGIASRPSEAAGVRTLMKEYALNEVCITLGERGATLYTLDAEFHSPGYRVDVVDTVGSGDAFTAGLVVQLLKGTGYEEALDFANLVGAYVASQPGATPSFDAGILKAFARGRGRTA
jgi:fructokinase